MQKICRGDSPEKHFDLYNLNLLDASAQTNENECFSKETFKSNLKTTYKDKKIENRLKKYESIIKNVENINRVELSEYLFAGNGGLSNNLSYEFLEEIFSKYGKVVDIVMQKKKPYAFIIYEDKVSTNLAVESLQSEIITCNQTPICFYLFPVDKVPDLCLDSGYKEMEELPQGLIYIDDFIDNSYANKILEFIIENNNSSNQSKDVIDLKKRRVKHYGYEFRYGTNDCDENKPLEDPESRMPEICQALFDKLLSENLIDVAPDQMTVNIYEPGQGIPPHIDNTVAFDEYIISLSLMSGVVMEFRQKESKKFSKIYLKPNSLLILKGESRYKWLHLIQERKHDLISKSENCFTVIKREKRISLTFRKLKPLKSNDKNNNNKTDIELKLPSSDSEARNFERSYVHDIYNKIADHFSSTRHSAWPGVAKFIDSMDPFSSMLDIGCGNGKYLNLRKDLFCFGCDFSDQLIEICNNKNFNCFVSDCLNVPCKNENFDYAISIAVLHHLSTQERRIKALNEICRVLKKGGKALVTVWAKEQKYKNKESYYISQKNANNLNKSNEPLNKNKKTNTYEITKENEDENPLIHKFGKEFEKKDLFVAWHYNSNTQGAKSKIKNSPKCSESNDVDIKSTNNENENENKPEEKVYLRFYHVFENQELEELFKNIENVKIIESFYEQGNWCAIFEKI